MGPRFIVSVVIPCYNQGHFLKDALDSLNRSTYPHLEVIVIDDGSTDEDSVRHVEALHGYQVKGRPVTFLRQPNQGLSATRNNGIRIAGGEFILPLDADDFVDPTFIEKCVWVLTKHPHVSIVYPSVQHFGARDDIWYPRPYDFQALLQDNFMIATSMFRKKVWDDVGGYDESLPAYEDWDFWIRSGAIGHVGYWLPEPLFFYRKKEESMLVEANKKRHLLVKAIRQKNADIYDRARGSHAKEEPAASTASGSGSPLRWKLFVFYVRVASKVPPSIKERLRRLVKPVIRRVFGYSEEGLEQSQTLEPNAVDAYIEQTYRYQPNDKYLEAAGDDAPREAGRLGILFIAPWLQVGGADKVNWDLMKEFAAQGHDVHMITTLKSDHKWHARFKEVTERITHLGNWFREWDETLDYVIDYIRSNRIDVIQMSNSQFGYQMAGTLRQYCPEVKIVDLLHMEEPYYPFDYFRYSVRFKDCFDHRVVITPYLKEAMVRKYGETAERVTVIPNGIEVPDRYEDTGYPEKQRRSQRTIGFIGRMEEQKQPLDVIKTAHLVLMKRQDVRFVLIGDGSLLSPAKALADSLGIADRVEFLGSRNDAKQLMQEQFDVFFAPSLREGLPIVGLEALSCGVPIVASKVPGWFELVPDNTTGTLAPQGDCQAFADACLALLEDADMRLAISRQAYELARDVYAIEKTASAYLEIYRGGGEEDSFGHRAKDFSIQI